MDGEPIPAYSGGLNPKTFHTHPLYKNQNPLYNILERRLFMNTKTESILTKAKQILKQYFGYEQFRIGQEEIISHLLQHEDVLGIMPTGAR